ncbi:hypothetical protein GCM10009844_39440 [Nocardioides koreensis]|uniref:Uncharacterized protein n=1 Tax=Nocardioides koreensis TaxID=433651 RepID=A0ABN3A501_9ACTN
MTEPTPTIHDRDVARLPLQDARADLLEEIMATPVVEQLDHRPSRRPAPAWLAVSAAAVAIATIALVPAVRSALADPAQAPVATSPAAPAPSASAKPEPGLTSVPDGRYVALDAPGWSLTFLYSGEGETDIAYSRGEQSLEMVQYPADAYDSYLEDRLHVSDPVATELLGKPSSTFTYSPDDHATMRPAQNGSFLEVRGSGMDLAAYHELLGRIVQTDERGLAASVPAGVVTPFNKDEAVTHLLQDVDVPDGFTAADVEVTGFNDAYQSAARVAGSVGCAWLDVYADGGPAARQRALAAFDASRDWPLLKDTVRRGDYAEVFWGVADQLRAGQPVASVRRGIC